MNVPPNVAVDELLEQLAESVAEKVAAKLGDGASAASENGGGADGWRLLTAGELAERLGRSPRWVHAAVKDRGLPFVRLDERGGRMFDLEDVRAWARARRVPAAEGERE